MHIHTTMYNMLKIEYKTSKINRDNILFYHKVAAGLIKLMHLSAAVL